MELETFSCRLVEGEKYIVLGPIAYNLVLSLAEAKGRRITRERLVELTWTYPAEEPDNPYNSLKVTVNKIRRDLRLKGMSPVLKSPGGGWGNRPSGYWIENVTIVHTRQEDAT